jgi:hypothetical protein
MLLRELAGGDPPYVCTLVFVDDPAGFGHRVVDGGRVVRHVLTDLAGFERAAAEKAAEGFAETGRSLTRRVFVTADEFWVVMLDGDTLRTQSGGRRACWSEAAGHTRDRLFRDRDRAVAAYHRAVAGRVAGGFREWHGRAVPPPVPPPAPKTSGRKGSR